MTAWKLAPWFVFVLALPAFADEARHVALDDVPRITQTKLGLHGDPINVALVGTKEDLIAAMLAAKWQPADPITFKSSAKLAASVVLHKPDEKAPVSNLYLWKHKEDLAFEQQVGPDARRRHHVRLWLSAKQVNGRPLWVGAATFDTKVGFSHKTGLITHHIDANIDADRDKLMEDLKALGRMPAADEIEGFQTQHDGHNGGGDAYHTDGKLLLGSLDNQGR